MAENYMIPIYAQHCVLSGCIAHEPGGYAGENWPWDDDDLIVYHGTYGEILDHINELEKGAAQQGAGTDLYFLRTARTLREQIGAEKEGLLT